MCDGMFTSHVNAIINICADLKENCVCNHVNLFYTKLTIKRRSIKENKMSAEKTSLDNKIVFLSFRAKIYREHMQVSCRKMFFLYNATKRMKIE